MTRVPTTQDDEAFLDALFDFAVRARADGASLDGTVHASERPHLASEIRSILELARDVAIGGAPETSLRPPTLPGYVLMEEIGRGGSGVVFRARQESVGRTVALKTLAPALVMSRRARDRFAAEARALGRVEHPHVVRVHDVIVGDDVCGLAMEFVEGSTLAAAIAAAGGRLDVAVAVRHCAAVARALAAVHAAELVHRDVKPANILLRKDGSPVLVDFGLVRDAAAISETATGEFVGTTAYAAPEQIRGDRSAADARTDVYGLGVTLYAALAGRTPFGAATAPETLRRIEEGAGEPLARARPGTPADLCAVVEKALEPDPSRRYATATEMADDLERFGRFEPVRARRASPGRRIWRFLRRHRRTALAAVVAAALALLAAGAWIASRQRAIDDQEEFRSLVRVARLALLDPDAQVRLFIALNDPGAEAWSRGLFSAESVERALVAYDAALALRADEAAQLERDTAALVLGLLRHEANVAPPSPLMVAACPTTLETAAAWRRAGRPRPFVAPPSASPADLRHLGLLAFLCADVAGAVRAWEPLEGDAAFDDPLVAAALGAAWLAVDRPALAAPRLARAVREFPEAHHLRLDLADALIRVGDLTRASAEFRAAEPRLGPRDTYLPQRLTADLAFAQGDRIRARRLYDAAVRSPTTCLHHAKFLASEGEVAAAFEIAADAYVPFPRNDRFRRFMIELVEPSWGALTRRERAEVLFEAATGPLARAPAYAVGLALDRRGRLGAATAREDGVPFGRLVAAPIAFRALHHERLRSSPAAARVVVAAALVLDEILAAHPSWRRAAAEAARSATGEPWSPPGVVRPRSPWQGAVTAPTIPGVALIGDQDGDGGGDLLVGDPLADKGRGEARVVGGRSGATLLRIPAGAASAFGRSVAPLGDLDGDGFPEAAIGAEGRVRVHRLRDGALHCEVAASEDPGFGASVATCGDLDRDGVADFAVGAPIVGRVSYRSGRSGAEFREIVRGRGFGGTLAGGGDADGDGVVDLLVGTPDGPYPSRRYGRTGAEIISGATGASLWSAGTSVPQQRFGASAAFVGDLDGDGREDWAVGVPENLDPCGASAGWVAIYAGPDGRRLASLGGDSLRLEAFGVAVGRWAPDASGSPQFFAASFDLRDPLHGVVVESFRVRDGALTARSVASGFAFGGRAAVAVGDFDGDGRLSAFAASYGADGVRLLRAR